MIDDKLAWHDHIDYLFQEAQRQNVLFQEAWIIFMLTKEFLLCFTNPSLPVFGGIVCYVGVGTLVKGAGTK